MTMRVPFLLSLLASLGCGATVASPSPGPDADESQAEGGTSDAATDTDPRRHDGEWPTCDSGHDDCRAYGCYEGICCNGDVVSGKCVCGDGVGCAAGFFCCFAGSLTVKECVPDRAFCAGD